MARLTSPKRNSSTPFESGYRMPAEWEPHKATWLAWPHERTDWPGKFAPIPWVYADIVRRLSRVERVRILIGSAQQEKSARRMLKKSGAELGAVEFFRIPTNRGWTRDYGPIFVKKEPSEEQADAVARVFSPRGPARGEGPEAFERGRGIHDVAITNWRFNAWAKYDDWKYDNAATSKLIPKLKLPYWEPQFRGRPIVLEGGSIDVNGQGTLLTTEECLLSPVQSRNPGLSRADIEGILRDYLGATNVLWLGNGIAGDDTHGHVDDLAHFVSHDTVVTVVETDASDANYAPLRDNLARLRAMKDQDGKPLRIETLPMPQPVFFDGQRLPASYANFYIANRLVLVPTFNDANDRIALNTLARLFPDREIVGISCRDLVLGLGTLHCMTQQQPA